MRRFRILKAESLGYCDEARRPESGGRSGRNAPESIGVAIPVAE
jgi:hypothetical protein